MNSNTTKDRYKYVGGSDLPIILGTNKFETTLYDLVRIKAQIIPNQFNGNQYTRYGQLMEPVIRDYINSILSCTYLEDTIVDETRGLRGNTDGIDKDAEIPLIEIKTFGEKLDIDYYEPQCQFYMETFNVDSCLLVGYKRPDNFYSGVEYTLENDDSYFNLEFNSDRIETHVINRDKAKWQNIEHRIKKFKEAVLAARENPHITDDEISNIIFGNELIVMANKLSQFTDKLAQYDKLKNEYEELKEALYNKFDEVGLVSFDYNNVKITKVNPTSYDRVSVDTKKLQDEEPEIYEKYKKVTKTNKKGYVLVTVREDK